MDDRCRQHLLYNKLLNYYQFIIIFSFQGNIPFFQRSTICTSSNFLELKQSNFSNTKDERNC